MEMARTTIYFPAIDREKAHTYDINVSSVCRKAIRERIERCEKEPITLVSA